MASLSTKTGNPSRSPRTLRSGTSASGTLTDDLAVPLSKSTTDGTPTPIALIPSVPISSMSAQISAISASASVASVRLIPWCSSVPSSSTATAIFVPPTSTPMYLSLIWLKQGGGASRP